jgi:hypothetical protein
MTVPNAKPDTMIATTGETATATLTAPQSYVPPANSPLNAWTAAVSKIAELRERLAQLEAASRPGEPLSDKSGPTVQGHIVSAISKLKRELELARINGDSSPEGPKGPASTLRALAQQYGDGDGDGGRLYLVPGLAHAADVLDGTHTTTSADCSCEVCDPLAPR